MRIHSYESSILNLNELNKKFLKESRYLDLKKLLNSKQAEEINVLIYFLSQFPLKIKNMN